MTACADHGEAGNGEPLAIVLRVGNAGSNHAAEHIATAWLGIAQLPRRLRRAVLIRADSGGGTREFLTWLTARSWPLHDSAGMTITDAIADAIGQVPADAWTPAYDGDGEVRDGAWVADITGLLDTGGWPPGMRVIVRKERPHPGAQLRFTDIDGHRFTAFATDAKRGRLADLELRHRRRARCEDRIRGGKDTGLRNLPLKGFAQNQVWWGSSPWPASCWPGLRCSRCPARPAAGSPDGYGCACSPSPAAWSAVAGACGSAWPDAGYGPSRSPPQPPACRPSHPADQAEQPRRPGRRTPGPVEPRSPGAAAGQSGTADT
jgi:hypothetical protein